MFRNVLRCSNVNVGKEVSIAWTIARYQQLNRIVEKLLLFYRYFERDR